MLSGYKMRLLPKRDSHGLSQCGSFFHVKSTCSSFFICFEYILVVYNASIFILYIIGKLSFHPFKCDYEYTRIPTHIVTIFTASIDLYIQLSYSFPIQILTLKMYMVVYGYSESDYIINKVAYIEIDDIWNKQWIVCYFLFSKHCIFAITQWLSYQYMTYYIPLESSDFSHSNGIIFKVKFPHIFHLLNLLFQYLIHLQCN